MLVALVEQVAQQDQLAVTHSSQASLPLAVAVAVPISPAPSQVVLAVAPLHQMTSSLEPMAHQDKALRVAIRLQRTSQRMVQVVADQEAWAKMA